MGELEVQCAPWLHRPTVGQNLIPDTQHVRRAGPGPSTSLTPNLGLVSEEPPWLQRPGGVVQRSVPPLPASSGTRLKAELRCPGGTGTLAFSGDDIC